MTTENLMKKNIILIGFMGSGKTVIGRQVAQLLDFDFADTDEEIRQVTGMQLPQLFHKHGEIRFRSEERLVINKLAARTNLVIACGGSLPPQEENLQHLAENGWFVLLTAKPEIIRERINRKRDRLLLNGKPTPDYISTQAARWEADYAAHTDLKIDSGALDVDRAAALIADTYKQQFVFAQD